MESPSNFFLVPTAREKADAQLFALLLAVSVLVLTPLASIELARQPRTGAVYGLVQFTVDMLAAAMIARRAPRTISSVLVLAAFLFSASMGLAHAILFPGAFRDDGKPLVGSTTGLVGWMYIIWKVGVAFLLAAAVRLKRRRFAVKRRIALVALLIPVATAVTLAGTSLPSYLAVGDAFSRITKVTLYLTLFVSLSTTITIWWNAHRESIFYLALALMCAVLTSSLAMSALSDGRYTFGWYTARVMNIGATLLFLYYFGTSRGSHRIEDPSRFDSRSSR